MGTINRRDFVALSTCVVGAGGTSIGAFAQENYPNRPILLVAPAAAGGLTDLLSRAVAEGLGKRLKGSVVVENKVGAGGTVGMGAVARAAPDGYSAILAFQGPATVAASLYGQLSYDTFRDFAAIGMVGTFHNVLTVGSGTAFKNAKEVIDEARKRPGALNYATPGIGSTGHLAGELFQQQAGIKLNHVPYKGEAPALQDVASGQVHMTFSTLAGTKALAEAGKVRMIGVTTPRRASFAPQIPTISESGLDGSACPRGMECWCPGALPTPSWHACVGNSSPCSRTLPSVRVWPPSASSHGK